MNQFSHQRNFCDRCTCVTTALHEWNLVTCNRVVHGLGWPMGWVGSGHGKWTDGQVWRVILVEPAIKLSRRDGRSSRTWKQQHSSYDWRRLHVSDAGRTARSTIHSSGVVVGEPSPRKYFRGRGRRSTKCSQHCTKLLQLYLSVHRPNITLTSWPKDHIFKPFSIY